MSIQPLLRHPLFGTGLLLRLALIALATPTPVSTWYLPFLQASTLHFSLDPWAAWLAQGGTPMAFPYGYAMWCAFAPLIWLFRVLGWPALSAYGATLLMADVALLLLLRKMIPGHERRLLASYWLSPIVIVATYLLGYNDLIPVLLLTLALYCVKTSRLAWSGAACIAAISAKLAMLLALPFFLIYLLHNRALRQFLPRFLQGLGGAMLLAVVPFLFSTAGLSMLFDNPEMVKVYALALDLGGNTVIYLAPLAYLLMVYAAWRFKRLNFELFHAMLGMAFLSLVLMTPASPGWFIWAIPLLVAYQAASDRVAIAMTGLFSLLYVLSSLLLTAHDWASFGLPEPALAQARAVLSHYHLVVPAGSKAASIMHTAMVAAGIILALRIWHETVRRNDYFRLSQKPFVIGIAGDSGSGKDTFSDAIQGLFGAHSVSTLSGDDYHLWDRQRPMWQVMTHLNPIANDLAGFADDLVALTDGKSIRSGHYNHQSGRMSRPSCVKSNDIIIASGLHALYLPILRECYNLSIYLDIDEGLRRHFKLQRDVGVRGHPLERVLASFERREPDAVRFIRPQALHADLVLSLQPIHPRMLQERCSGANLHQLRFKLVARSRHGLNELSLTRVLVGICGLHVDMAVNSDATELVLTVEGETSALDIALAARMVCPRIFEFLDLTPHWQDGVIGLMQLITLSHINQALTRRFI
ncbi:MAG: uridine kinase [Janthinobacterium sp.]|jgi:uridine kinase